MTERFLEHGGEINPENQQILIVSTKFDPHVDVVAQKLNAQKIPFIRFNTEDYPLDSTVSSYFDNKTNCSVISLPGNLVFSNQSVKAVWYRRPAPYVFPESFPDEIKVFAQEESTTAIRGLWQILDCLWLNHPENNRKAENKLNQLRLASQLGLNIPDTIVTNNPKDAGQFIKNHSTNGVIIKRMGGNGIFNHADTPQALYTNVVTKESIQHIDSIHLTPVLLQEKVEKEFELRVTIVGDEIFAAEIHSQKSDKAKIDWRRDTLNLEHKIHDMPEDEKQKILKMTHYFGLNYGAIDMIVTPDGKYVFLEINPNGQWAWIEDLTGLPISDSLIRFLAGGRLNT